MSRSIDDRSEIQLRQDDHTYVLNDGTELGPSVSTVAASPWPPFDSAGCARRCGPAARLKWTGDAEASDEKIIAAWESNGREAADRGTRIHADIETMLLNRAEGGTGPVPDTLCPTVTGWINDRFPPDEYHLYPELIVYGSVYDGGRDIPGTIDLVAVRRHGQDPDDLAAPPCPTATLVDWKTGSVDDTKGAKDPLFGIKGTRLAKYSIQLGLYKLILERHYGVGVDSLEVVQITPGRMPTVHLAKPEISADLCASIAAMFDG